MIQSKSFPKKDQPELDVWGWKMFSRNAIFSYVEVDEVRIAVEVLGDEKRRADYIARACRFSSGLTSGPHIPTHNLSWGLLADLVKCP